MDVDFDSGEVSTLLDDADDYTSLFNGSRLTTADFKVSFILICQKLNISANKKQIGKITRKLTDLMNEHKRCKVALRTASTPVSQPKSSLVLAVRARGF